MLSFDFSAPMGEAQLKVSASVERGLGIEGPSGAGKSSLLHVLAGLRNPTSGVITGPDGAWWNDSTQCATASRRVGVMFQDDRLFPHMDVLANLCAGARDGPIKQSELIDALGLGPLLTRRPAVLSGGERRRVALGRALLTQPQVLLLDEPLTGLDAALHSTVVDFIGRCRDALEAPMLVVSHHLDALVQLTDDIISVDGGRVRVRDRPVVNIIDGVGHGDYVMVGSERLPLTCPSGAVRVVVRPESVVVTDETARVGRACRLTGTWVAPVADVVEVDIGQRFFAQSQVPFAQRGEAVACWFSAGDARVIPSAR